MKLSQVHHHHLSTTVAESLVYPGPRLLAASTATISFRGSISSRGAESEVTRGGGGAAGAKRRRICPVELTRADPSLRSG
jgi:hypothetical protein